MIYDCVIVGGGPAGLNAALMLGRARRSVLLMDNSQPRNSITRASHGFITRDGIQPAEFRRIAYREVLSYPSVHYWQAEVADIRRTDHGFHVRASSNEHVQARKLILAVGLKEVFPEIKGFRSFYGKSLFNCPYCDGWELRDQPLAVISDDSSVFYKAKLLMGWSRDLVVCTNGRNILSAEQRQQLTSRGIGIVNTPITAFTGRNGSLKQIHFSDGTYIERSGGFITPKLIPYARFDTTLGYQTAENGRIVIDTMGRTTATGVYAAGDSAYGGPSQLIAAAASGSKAAMAVISNLAEENW